ncbi:MAG: hypothetical protein RBT11_08630 [Desulfobacterales bacterium]|jgi:hypothetical protein|nr:hypothetical protein [Desulfobacterales bacterium]
MKLKDIFQQLAHLKIVETRVMDDEYVELVFLNMDLGAWYKTLAANLGEPRKQAGSEPTREDQTLTRQTGGIWVNQTLFEKSFGDVTVIAKFWPWGDEVHTTLKMALLIH